VITTNIHNSSSIGVIPTFLLTGSTEGAKQHHPLAASGLYPTGRHSEQPLRPVERADGLWRRPWRCGRVSVEQKLVDLGKWTG